MLDEVYKQLTGLQKQIDNLVKPEIPGALLLGDNLLADTLTHEESWQFGTTLNDVADDTYSATLWNTLNSGNAPDISGQAGGATDPFTRSFRCTFDTAAQQAGIVQFLPAQLTRVLRGKTVSLSADLWGTNVSNMRMAVIYWTSTADTITSDVVGTWAAGNPTLATNWSYVGTPASIAITTTRARKSVLNLAIPTSANNLGVFIWTPDSEGSGDLWEVARVKLELGTGITDFVGRKPTYEMAEIDRFYQKSYNVADAPGTVTTNGCIEVLQTLAIAASTAGTTGQIGQRFRGTMRVAPTVVIYSPDGGTANAVRNATAGTERSGATAIGVGQNGFARIDIDNTDADAIAANSRIRYHYTADARL